MLAFLTLIGFIALAIFFVFYKKPGLKKPPVDAPLETAQPETKAQQKGRQGEQIVIQHYAAHFDAEYLLLNNCTFADQANGSTQIDHILLSPYGIFVIETKHYSGWIFGAKDDKKWTQRFANQETYSFQNPLLQNYKHISVMKLILEDLVAAHCLHPVVVFTGNSEFKRPMPSNVCSGEAWVGYVKTFRTQVLSSDEIQKIAQHLNQTALAKTAATDQWHQQNLQRKFGEKQ